MIRIDFDPTAPAPAAPAELVPVGVANSDEQSSD